ncbi:MULTISPECIES: hypothetical protein [unclassified Arcicella]|uniref:hypothetical protein n=1 Tax=unclassified Arcicella TaxID=2644986 RepID=UPI0028550A1A|nr:MULTISPECIES: hypothetical protein [unclassified Arcicella]MDR6564953.1 hypothetical protein [Arcicella sp. BE51]MDR6814743.1 hypothetical protein [Arcicella sp. BE140]MDR6826189.1 hypothetical protein [Arcicella sp. BE139]
MDGLVGNLLGTIKTDNSIGFDTPSLLRAGGIAIISGILIGISVKVISKFLRI